VRKFSELSVESNRDSRERSTFDDSTEKPVKFVTDDCATIDAVSMSVKKKRINISNIWRIS